MRTRLAVLALACSCIHRAPEPAAAATAAPPPVAIAAQPAPQPKLPERALAQAVPARIKAVLLAEHPWARAQVHRALAERLSLLQIFDELQRSIAEACGFDPENPEAIDANGFRSQSGVALYTVPDDPEALVFAVGISDEAKALAVARRVVSRAAVGRYSGGPFQLADSSLPDGTRFVAGTNPAQDKVGILARGGFLYLRLPGATDPALSLATAGAPQSLADDPAFASAARHVGAGDATFFSPGPRGATAFALQEEDDAVRMRFFFAPRDIPPDRLAALFVAEQPPVELTAHLPPGPAAVISFSAAPQAIWSELLKSGEADAAHLRDQLAERTGLDLEKDLIPSFSGNFALAIYLDTSSLLDAVLGQQVGFYDRSTFLLAAQLSQPQVIGETLDQLFATRPSRDRARLADARWYRLADGAQAAVRGDLLLLSVGGPLVQKKKKPKLSDLGVLGAALKGGETLWQELRQGEVQLSAEGAWLDIAGIARSIAAAGDSHGGVAGEAAHVLAQRFSGLRDAILTARPARDGVEGELVLRFTGKAP